MGYIALNQILKINKKKCQVIYIHPKGRFYTVKFKNGIRETIHPWEFEKVAEGKKIEFGWKG